ncbi:hypothetical protein RJ492_004450 [Pluralibacter gergoviae]|uniref:Uncharacterized protein n=1 Tax=Pluralibacter gergoviae TaxID=61647 RepID=A0AAI9GNF6_PLUGE|nr:hypothetical protein [Pluralibacter gergoviae]EKV0932804.1 hypothetical protein [Pluralibacter gergoviae]EKV0933314.1 hypothetical protein [Pluralibacter gergoviae]EKV9910370.1 hypothetical protein [Pluralibacter gergoviae]EKW7275174.1 hypothetical protein [Pluralibacter gergoviae]
MLDGSGIIKGPATGHMAASLFMPFMMWLKGHTRDLRYTLSPHSLIHSDPQ